MRCAFRPAVDDQAGIARMAGHSQFKNIMFRKGAQDKKRGKVFTKLIRELTTAARMGVPDPASTRVCAPPCSPRARPTCRRTRSSARSSAAPAPRPASSTRRCATRARAGGVAVIVEALTDNRNRTASDVRAAFTKSSGRSARPIRSALCSTGSARSPIRPARRARTTCSSRDRGRRRRCRKRRRDPCRRHQPEDFNAARDALETRFGEAASAKVIWRPKTTAPVDEDTATTLFKMLETLEDSGRCAECLRQFRSGGGCSRPAERVIRMHRCLFPSPALRERVPEGW